MTLTDLHLKLIELDRKRSEVKKFFEDYQNAINSIVETYGIGNSFQDDQGIVYQVVPMEGKWVTFEKYGLERTKRPGEERGSLSVKRAQELGYKI